MKKLSSQHYMLAILSVAAIAVSIGAYVFMYRTAMQSAVSAAAARASVAAAKDAEREAEEQGSIYQKTAAARASLPSFLVNDNNALAFIQKVESVGKESGAAVSISSLSSGAAPGSSKQAVSAIVSMNGSWQAVMRAIGLVESLPYALSVRSVNLNSSPAAVAPAWSASISLSVLSAP